MWTGGGVDITRLRVALNSCFANAPENKTYGGLRKYHLFNFPPDISDG